jgi:hypothetical protein
MEMMEIEKFATEMLLEVDRLKKEGYSMESIQQGLQENADELLSMGFDAGIKGIKDRVAVGVIRGLGFKEGSFSSRVIRNAFALADFNQYGKIVSGDCDVISGLVSQSLIKTFLDEFTENFIPDNFITNSLKFGLMEAVEQSNIGEYVEKEIKPKICELTKNGWSSIASMASLF